MATHAQCDLFLADVRRNLRVMRQVHGAHSPQYRRLVRLYRDVAGALGCRPALERMLHRLRRRAPCPGMPLAAQERGHWRRAHTARQWPPGAPSRARVARSASSDAAGLSASPPDRTLEAS